MRSLAGWNIARGLHTISFSNHLCTVLLIRIQTITTFSHETIFSSLSQTIPKWNFKLNIFVGCCCNFTWDEQQITIKKRYYQYLSFFCFRVSPYFFLFCFFNEFLSFVFYFCLSSLHSFQLPFIYIHWECLLWGWLHHIHNTAQCTFDMWRIGNIGPQKWTMNRFTHVQSSPWSNVILLMRKKQFYFFVFFNDKNSWSRVNDNT